MNPKPEKLRRDVILKFKNLQVTARTLKDELVPFVLCWINLIEIHVKYIFRSLRKKSIACFGVVSKIGKYKDIINYALGLRLFRLVQNWVLNFEISVKPSFARRIVLIFHIRITVMKCYKIPEERQCTLISVSSPEVF